MTHPDKSQWRWRRAITDLVRGIEAWQGWSLLAYQDVRQRYVRSVLGEFWISISLGISILSIGVLYGGIFDFPMESYLPYLAAGVAGWTLISSALNEGSQAFIADHLLLLQSSQPRSLYIFRVLLRTFIVFAHNQIIVLMVCVAFGVWPTWWLFTLIPNSLLVLVNVGWAALLLAIVATRFRDIPPILGNVLQILFFLTPIIWKPEQVPDHLKLIVDLNPLKMLLELLRSPFLGTSLSISTYVSVVLLAVVGWLIAIALYARTRHRIIYWL